MLQFSRGLAFQHATTRQDSKKMAKAIISAFDAVLDAEKDLRFLAANEARMAMTTTTAERGYTVTHEIQLHCCNVCRRYVNV